MMIDNNARTKKYDGKTPHTSHRLTPATKSMLRTLSRLDGLTDTATITRLIRREYNARQDEIKQFREYLKNDEILRENEQNEE